MVVRKSGVVLLAFLVGLFLAVASWPYFSYQDDYFNSFTGNSVKEAVGNFYETSTINQRIFILSQILLLITIIVAVFFVIGKFKVKRKLRKKDFMGNMDMKRSRTDLDILYNMMQKKREIGLEEIEETFKVNSDIALGWAKIFENGDVAEIDYPRFGKPVLRLLSKDERRAGNADNLIENSEGGEKVDLVKVEKKGVKIMGKSFAKKEAKGAVKKKKVKVKKAVKGKKVVKKEKKVVKKGKGESFRKSATSKKKGVRAKKRKK